MQKVPHHIRAWRKKKGLSLRELANRMEAEPGVPLLSHVSIGRIERFEQPYSQDVLEALATALGRTKADLLERDPDIDPVEQKVIDISARLQAAPPDVQEQAIRVLEALLPNVHNQ
jgi:transcriptional regulator with XRE-family HTH domain